MFLFQRLGLPPFSGVMNKIYPQVTIYDNLPQGNIEMIQAYVDDDVKNYFDYFELQNWNSFCKFWRAGVVVVAVVVVLVMVVMVIFGVVRGSNAYMCAGRVSERWMLFCLCLDYAANVKYPFSCCCWIAWDCEDNWLCSQDDGRSEADLIISTFLDLINWPESSLDAHCQYRR